MMQELFNVEFFFNEIKIKYLKEIGVGGGGGGGESFWYS